MDRLSAQNSRMNKLNEVPTFLEMKYANSSKVFEAAEIIEYNIQPDELHEAEKLYYAAVEKLEKGEELDEGFFSGLLGGTVGALVGPTIGKAICNVLGIDTKGHLGKLLTSRLVTTAMGIALAK